MLIKEEKYIYVIKITRLICVDNIITVGAHALSSNPASLASPGSVNLTALIAGVEGRVGNALPTAVTKLLIMPLSCIWAPSSMAHIPWLVTALQTPALGAQKHLSPFAPLQKPSILCLEISDINAKSPPKFSKFFP